MKKLIFLFIFLELYLGIYFTRLFGFWVTLLIYFVPTFFGMPLVILQNKVSWSRFMTQMSSYKILDQSLFRLAAGFFGSVLLLVPSLICRAIALLLLFPPTRFLLFFLAKGWLAKKMAAGSFKVFSKANAFSFDTSHPEDRFERDAKVIDIEAIKGPKS